MKKYYVYLTLLLGMGFIQCKKLSLDLAPEDYFSSVSFWKNADQVNGAMLGLHSGLRGNMFTFFTMGELRGGTFLIGTDFAGLSSLNEPNIIGQNLRETDPGISGWGRLYGSIFQVNNFIYQVEQANYLEEKDKNYFLGQAYGIRAFYYFYLFRTYGRVPIVKLPEVAIKTPRSAGDVFRGRAKTEKEVMDFIKADIDLSEKSFVEDRTIKAQKSQWSLAATEMLKAEVYLWSAKVPVDGKTEHKMQDLQTANTAVTNVIDKGGFMLLPDFAQVFQSASRPASKGNSEIIFAFRYLVGEETNQFSQFLYAQNADLAKFDIFSNGSKQTSPQDPLRVAGSGTTLRYEYKPQLADTFCTGDKRGPATFLKFTKKVVQGNERKTGSVMRKFLGTLINGVRDYSDDWPVYRLSEAYLLRAEIKNAMGGSNSSCKEDIMKVRDRAFGKMTNSSVSVPECKGTGIDEIELEIFWERTKEFVAEGKRWFDLRRMQKGNKPLAFYMFKADGLLGVLSESEQYKLLWPIDLGTLRDDPTLQNDQNPGYPGT